MAYPSVNPGNVSAGFYWDTTGYSPGEHIVSAEFVPYLRHLGARTTREVTITLVADAAGEQPYSPRNLANEQREIDAIDELMDSSPVDAGAFVVYFDYEINRLVVAFKGDRDIAAWQQWASAHGYDVIGEQYWHFETPDTLAKTAVAVQHEAELMDRFDQLLPLETEAFRIYKVEEMSPRYNVKIKEKMPRDEGIELLREWLKEEGFDGIRSQHFAIYSTEHMWTVQEATEELRSRCPITDWGDFTIDFDEGSAKFVVTFESKRDLDYWRQWMDLHDYGILVGEDLFIFKP